MSEGGGQLILLDGDLRRRAQVSHGLSENGQHVEPFEDVSELITHWPRSGLIVVHDDGATLDRLLEHMNVSGNWLPLLAFAEAPAIKRVVKAMQIGVLDYLIWPFADGELVAAVREAEERGRARTIIRQRAARARTRIGPLSQREREVLAAVADGLSNELIARRLDISPRTVEIHRAKMLAKLGASHTSEAIRIAIEAGLEE